MKKRQTEKRNEKKEKKKKEEKENKEKKKKRERERKLILHSKPHRLLKYGTYWQLGFFSLSKALVWVWDNAIKLVSV